MITDDIKMNAKVIWNLVLNKKMLAVSEIKEITKFSETIIFLALGWLFKEKKVHFQLDNDDTFCVKVNDPYIEAISNNKPYTDIFY